MDGEEDPARHQLEVYETKTGLWHPEFGELAEPDGWEFLAAGDAFLTRRVKAAGVYWVLFQPKGRRAHRRQLGLLAPAAAIEAAHAEAEATRVKREANRVVGARQREKSEAAYRDEFERAVVQWLDFLPDHAELAADIARHSAQRAAVVGSGRVGRTKTIGLEDRAALAARAFIRHRYTDYEERLFAAEFVDVDDLDDLDVRVAVDGPADYRAIKRAAHREVDDFLARHRAAPEP